MQCGFLATVDIYKPAGVFESPLFGGFHGILGGLWRSGMRCQL